MSSFVTLATRADGVAVLTFDQDGSKANVFTEENLAAFEAALDDLAGRPDIRGLVLGSAKPGVFVAGADLKVFADATPNDPRVRAFIERGLRVTAKLEALPFPTCAAIDGAALGGGLEVALACDFRICGTHPKVQLGLPEVNLGLIPGWGGTQRLPKLINAPYAVDMLTTGNSFTSGDGELFDFIDTVATADDGHLMGCAVGHVLNGATESRNRREQKRRSLPADYVAKFPREVDGGSTAVRELLDAVVRGTALPLDDGLKLETEAFLRLAGSDESKRLIAAFFASRKKA